MRIGELLINAHRYKMTRQQYDNSVKGFDKKPTITNFPCPVTNNFTREHQCERGCINCANSDIKIWKLVRK